MTKEQEIIEKLKESKKIDFNTLVRTFKKEGIENFAVIRNEYLETVLNMLKENSEEIQQKNTELAEKNTEIEKYKKLLADNLAKNLNDSIKAKEKADTDLDDLDKGWKVELEKKDKMIDLTLEFLAERDLGYYQKEEGGEIQGIFRKYNKDDWKQYFERKEENV